MRLFATSACAACALLSFAVAVPAAKAQVTYTYTGNVFEFPAGDPFGQTSVGASFTFAGALPANQALTDDSALVLAWDITVPPDILLSSSAPPAIENDTSFDVSIATDLNGNVVAWDFGG